MSKPIFTLEKVIDPHHSMPEKVKDAFFEALRDRCLGNRSYVWWRWNEAEEDDDLSINYVKIVDEWLLANGFVQDESILMLYWW